MATTSSLPPLAMPPAWTEPPNDIGASAHAHKHVRETPSSPSTPPAFSPVSFPSSSFASTPSSSTDEADLGSTLWQPKASRMTHDPSARVCLSDLPRAVRDALSVLDVGATGSVPLCELAEAARQHVKRVSPTERPALHGLIGAPNHVTLLVSDVAASIRFYRDALGLRMLPRPELADHGVWFGLGGLQLHLVEGIPVVHTQSEEELGTRCNHLSFETPAVQDVPSALERLGIPFRVNDVVYDNLECGTQIVRQVFFRDPDGYFIEMCNCFGEDDGPLPSKAKLH